MPARELAQLISAAEQFAEAYAGDPTFGQLAEQVSGMAEDLSELAESPQEGYDSPGRQAAAEAAGAGGPVPEGLEEAMAAEAEAPPEEEETEARRPSNSRKKRRRAGTAQEGAM